MTNRCCSFRFLRNVTLEVGRDKLRKSFIIPEVLLRRASKVLAEELDKIPQTCMEPSLKLDTTPLAFGELLIFVHHWKPFPQPRNYNSFSCYTMQNLSLTSALWLKIWPSLSSTTWLSRSCTITISSWSTRQKTALNSSTKPTRSLP